MGQSVVDLPDPLEQTQAEPLDSAGGVDDLLAQMASAEIDRLLAEGDIPREPTVTHVGSALADGIVPLPHAAEPVMTALEREALANPAPSEPKPMLDIPPLAESHPVDPPHTDAQTTDTDETAPEPPLPFYLKPLEWISRPMDAMPESVRVAVGKIALLTLFNALAVLIYVLLFRKHL